MNLYEIDFNLVENVLYNGNEIDFLIYNHNQVWERQKGNTYQYQVADTSNDFDTDLRIPFAYSYDDKKWRVFNNSSQYEEYGIYEQTDNLSSITTYPNKLAVVGNKEYQYQNNSWVEVGTYENSFGEVCELSSNMQGVQFPVNFAILKSDVERMGWFYIDLQGANAESIRVQSMGGDMFDYMIQADGYYSQGEVTSDDTYYYFNAPDDCPIDSFEVMMSQWWSEPIKVYGGSSVFSVKYDKTLFDNYDLRKGYYYKSFDDISDEIGYNLIVNVDGYIYKKQDEFIRANVNPYTYDNRLYREDKTLTEIKLLDECITSIGISFYHCDNLTSVTIGNSVTSIGNDAFIYCSSLTSITIPNSVTSIGGNAFGGCSNLTSITIPNSVTSIGGNAFYNCKSLTSVIYDGTISQWNAIIKNGNWKYNVPTTCIVHCTDGNIPISEA